jgi:uncharacterized damage-inducible protein DinB
MTESTIIMADIYTGWHTYQKSLIEALRPLSAEQLAFTAAPGLRSIAQLTAHIVAGRANWFYHNLKEGGDLFATLGGWDRPGLSPESAHQLIRGLEMTWQGMQSVIALWTPDQWGQTFTDGHPYAPLVITRRWIIWHLIEHDLHHGGEISLTMGVHGLAALKI